MQYCIRNIQTTLINQTLNPEPLLSDIRARQAERQGLIRTLGYLSPAMVVQLAVEGPYRTAATGVLMTCIGLRFAQAAWAGRGADAGQQDPVGRLDRLRIRR